MAFWGAEVAPGQTVPFVPPPEGHRLHLSQATLASWSTKGDQRAAVTCKTQDSNPLRICCLSERGQLNVNLDLIYDHYTEFQVEGAAVHLAGYHMPTHEEEDNDEGLEGLSPEEQQALRQQIGLGGLGNDDDYDSDEDEDYDMDDNDSDEDASDSDADPAQPSVIIEDVTENGQVEEPAELLAGTSSAKATPPAAGSAQQLNGSAQGGRAKRVRFSGGLTDGALSVPEAVSTPELVTPPAQTVAEPVAVSAAAAEADDKASKKKRKSRDAGSTPGAKPQSKAGNGTAPATAAAPAQEAQQSSKAAIKAVRTAAAAATPTAAAPERKKQVRRYENGFIVESVSMGQPEGKLAKPGRKIVVKYTGRLQKTGQVFDQSKGKGFSFRLGVGEVIKGWDAGVNGMRVGDKRKLTIPPQLAYGSSGVKGAIPPNSILLFDVELVDVK